MIVIAVYVTSLNVRLQNHLDCEPEIDYRELALNQWSMRVVESAIDSLTCEIELEETGNAYFLRGVAYYSLALNQPDVDDLTHALELEPDNDLYLSWRGSVYLEENQYVSAVNDLERAISINPNVPLYYAKLADIYVAVFNRQQAEAILNHAVEQMPQNADAYVWRGQYYYEMENFDKSREDFAAARNIDPEIATKYVDMGDSFLVANILTSALDSYSLAILIEPDLLEAYKRRATTYIRLGEPELVTREINMLYQLDNDPEHYKNFADAYYILGDYENAVLNYHAYLFLLDEPIVPASISASLSFAEEQIEHHEK